MSESNISVLILAAGNSGRMGRDKASLPCGNGLTFSEELISIYSGFGCSPVTMVVNERHAPVSPGPGQVKYVLNKQVDRGRSYSIWLGLQNTPGGNHCFIQNIDNPFADHSLLHQMYSAVRPERYIVPMCHGRGGHPILLGSEITAELRKMDDIPNLREALKAFIRFEVQFPDERILLNINTPEDYLKFINPG